MSAAVVDENVPIVANDATRTVNGLPALADQASDECRLAVVRFLRHLMASGIVVIDESGSCLAKYRAYLNGQGQPGTGDAFLRHVHDNAYNPRKIERVTLEVDADGEFVSFPTVAALSTFDPADRLFVAMALASGLQPTIANAVDSDYSQHRAALREAGVNVTELCGAGQQRLQRVQRPPRRRRRRRRR